MPLVPRHLKPSLQKALHSACPALCALLLSAFSVSASGVRLRDLVMVSGARDNQLVGFGLVAGLAGDGDKDPIYTKQTVANMLQRYGITVPATTLSAKNVAVVMVTADIPAFVKSGTRLDVQVASMGDAKSLQGGVLLQTPLLGADNKVYAVAQGPMSIGGFVAGAGGGGGASVTKNHPTVAQIIGGAIVEREIPTAIVRDNHRAPVARTGLHLRRPRGRRSTKRSPTPPMPWTPPPSASASPRASNPRRWTSSPGWKHRSHAGNARAHHHQRAHRHHRRHLPHPHFQLRRLPRQHHHQRRFHPRRFPAHSVQHHRPDRGDSRAPTTEVTENKSSVVPLPEMPTVEKVASALNSLGVTPRDVMAIFEAMKQAGALQAELDHPVT
jgi:flagellar P-ring protein precursor FlgI